MVALARLGVSYHNLVAHQHRLFLIDSFGFIFRAYRGRGQSAGRLWPLHGRVENGFRLRSSLIIRMKAEESRSSSAGPEKTISLWNRRDVQVLDRGIVRIEEKDLHLTF